MIPLAAAAIGAGLAGAGVIASELQGITVSGSDGRDARTPPPPGGVPRFARGNPPANAVQKPILARTRTPAPISADPSASRNDAALEQLRRFLGPLCAAQGIDWRVIYSLLRVEHYGDLRAIWSNNLGNVKVFAIWPGRTSSTVLVKASAGTDHRTGVYALTDRVRNTSFYPAFDGPAGGLGYLLTLFRYNYPGAMEGLTRGGRDGVVKFEGSLGPRYSGAPSLVRETRGRAYWDRMLGLYGEKFSR